MKGKLAEAQSHIDGQLVSRIVLDFAHEFRDTYPPDVHIAFCAVGPMQAMIGLAISRGYLSVTDAGREALRSQAKE
jgi:hypothetical protein